MLLAGVAIALSGCAAHATVEVSMRANGSGTVRATIGLDPEAVQAAEAGGVKLEQRVRLLDLPSAGWTVSAWKRAKDSSASLVLTKPFTTPGQVSGIVHELNGDTGPLRVQASRGVAWLGAGHTYDVTGLVDLTNVGTNLTTDQQLVGNLTGQHVDVNTINQQLAGQVKTSFAMRVVVTLPGGRRVVVTRPGRRTPISVTSTTIDVTRVVFVGAAVALLVLAMLAWWRGRRAGRRSRRRGRGRHAVTSRPLDRT